DVHLCDLSDIAKAMVSSLVITDAHAYDISLKCKPTFKSMWKSFNSDKCKDDFVCGEFAKARAMMGNALGFEVKCYSGGGHIWAVYRGKDRGGKIRKCRADNDILAYSTTSFFDSRIFYYFLLG
ncbi:MAG: hypothetical protein IJ733_10135, partial [Lachnospiraceae bacterium]|nr:hypothetical protein [Lachnospiraceae bacterium]